MGFFKKAGERVSRSYGGEYVKKKYGEFKEHQERQKGYKRKEEEAYYKAKEKYAAKAGREKAKQEFKQRMGGYKGTKQPQMKSEGGFFNLSPNKDVLDFRPSGMAFGQSMESPFGGLGDYAMSDRTRMKPPKIKKSPAIRQRLY